MGSHLKGLTQDQSHRLGILDIFAEGYARREKRKTRIKPIEVPTIFKPAAVVPFDKPKTVGVMCPRSLFQSLCKFSVDSWFQRG